MKATILSRRTTLSLVWLLVAIAPLRAGGGRSQPVALASGVLAVQTTVSDIDRAVDFYTHVLAFEKVSDDELSGDGYERLQGVFGPHVRIVRMRLGDEFIELAEYLAPRGRVIPGDSRSNDQSFSMSPSLSATWTRHTAGCGRTR